MDAASLQGVWTTTVFEPALVPNPNPVHRGGGGGGGGGGFGGLGIWSDAEVVKEKGDYGTEIISIRPRRRPSDVEMVPREALEREVLSLRRRVKNFEKERQASSREPKPDPQAFFRDAQQAIHAAVMDGFAQGLAAQTLIPTQTPTKNASGSLALAALIAAGTYFVIPHDFPALKAVGYAAAVFIALKERNSHTLQEAVY